MLEFVGLDDVPPNEKVYLIDNDLDQTIDLRRDRRYGFFQKTKEIVQVKKGHALHAARGQ